MSLVNEIEEIIKFLTSIIKSAYSVLATPEKIEILNGQP